MKIWGHRGASGYAPENTLEAFKLAVEMGADGVELDVHLSKDGVLMVAHDETIDRCSNGTGYIRDMTCEELKSYDYSYTFPEYKGATMPTLAEVLELIKPTGLTINIELKTNEIEYPGIERKCIDLVAEYGMTDRILYSSFNKKSIARISDIDPDLDTAFLYYQRKKDDVLPFMETTNCIAIHPYFQDMYEEDAIEDAHDLGFAVNAWTVNERSDMRHLMDLGVDAIISNYPDEVRKVYNNFLNSFGEDE